MWAAAPFGACMGGYRGRLGHSVGEVAVKQMNWDSDAPCMQE